MEHKSRHSIKSALERRLALVSRPENTGEDLQTSDYVCLAVVTVVIPALLMVAGWNL